MGNRDCARCHAPLTPCRIQALGRESSRGGEGGSEEGEKGGSKEGEKGVRREKRKGVRREEVRRVSL